MGKGKGSSSGKKPERNAGKECVGNNSGKKPVRVAAKECACLLLSGEKSIGLIDYLKKIAVDGDIMNVSPPPGEAATVVMVEGMLIDPAKEILFKLIHMVFRELERQLCFDTLEATNIVVTADGLLKITEDNTKDAFDSQIEENIHELGELIKTVAIACSKQFARYRTNAELKHLLALLKNYEFPKSTFLIKYPPALVPLGNRQYYHLIMSDHVLEIIRWNDARLFVIIMHGLEIPKNWYSLLTANRYVKEFLDRGTYDPTLIKASTVPDIQPLNCLRNLPSHSREGAASGHPKNLLTCGNASAPAIFTKEDIARATYIRLPLATCSMAKGLDFIGELSKLGLETLFPGRIQVIEEKNS